VRRAQLAECHQPLGNAAARQFDGEVVERNQTVEVHERLQLTVQRADYIRGMRSAFLLCLDAHGKLLRLLRDKSDPP